MDDEAEKIELFDFRRLESLRLLARQILQDQVASLKYFEYDVGYQHVRGNNRISVSSSATCVLSLVATDLWTSTHSPADTKKLLKDLIPRTYSAKLRPNNPFTAAWILEAVTALEGYSEPLDDGDYELIAKKEEVLQKEVTDSNGGVRIAPYPASPYLTQLVARALRRRGKLPTKVEEMVNMWAWAELARQLALVQAKSKTQDAFAIAYLLMLVTPITPGSNITPSSRITPEQASIQQAALKTVFDCQLPGWYLAPE